LKFERLCGTPNFYKELLGEFSYHRMKLISLVLFVGIYFNSVSQNLIRNPSFEEDSTTYKYWNPMMGSTVDFYSEKNPEKLNMGFQEAKSGSKFVGLSILKIDKAGGNIIQGCNRIQIELISPLKEKCTYLIQFFINLADSSTIVVNHIGAFFTLTPETARYQKEPNIYSNPEDYYSDAQNWTKIEGEYLAKGGERFLTIGNYEVLTKYKFFNVGTWRRRGTNFNQNASLNGYYYVDDVSVVSLGKKVIKRGDSYTLKNIHFKKNQSTILSPSFSELNGYIDLLKENPTFNVLIKGHTDDLGTRELNDALSLKRAEAVANYFFTKGIQPSRVEFKGYGSSFPLNKNSTEQEKSKNRRVEILVK
jgi:OmpA-OmpF porin, OOP family